MALPKLNALPQFELTIPSTGKKHKFRPYLVKEEKLLLLAAESKEPKEMMNAMVEIISSCAESDIDVKNLATFDVEYLFTQIRTRSVGGIITLSLKCDGEECGNLNEVKFNVEDVEIEKTKTQKVIKLTSNISVEMKYPSYLDIINDDSLEDKITTELMFKMIIKCISAILTEDERYDASDSTDEELMEFIESLTADQLSKLSKFIEDMPKMSTKVNYTCSKCGKEHVLELEGMTDFF